MLYDSIISSILSRVLLGCKPDIKIIQLFFGRLFAMLTSEIGRFAQANFSSSPLKKKGKGIQFIPPIRYNIGGEYRDAYT